MIQKIKKEFEIATKNRDENELKLIVTKLVEKYGIEKAVNICNHLLSKMSFEDEQFFRTNIARENYQKEIEYQEEYQGEVEVGFLNFAKKLIEYGLILGKDFSFAEGRVILSSEALEVVKKQVPESVYLPHDGNC